MNVAELPEISKLSIPKKILLLEDLWDSILRDESEIPMPESHKQELNSRFEKYQKSPGRLLALEDLQFGIEEKK